MRLYTRTKRRLAANRLAGQMTNKYQRKQATRTAGQLGNGLAVIDGQLYPTNTDQGPALAVVNVGRPAAAIYVAQSNGTITISGGGGSGGGGSAVLAEHGALFGLLDDDHPQYMLANGNRNMQGDLNMGGHDIYAVGQLNGHDVDEFFVDISAIQADVAALKSRTVTGGAGIIADGTTLGSGNPNVRVDLAGIAGQGLGATATQLEVKTTDRTKITSDAVDINQAAAFTWTGIHKHAATVQSDTWSVETAGWGITRAGAADFQEITSKYLYARNFVTDLELAKLGRFLLAQSPPELAADWTVANNGTFTVYELPGTSPGTRVYANGDWIQFTYIVRTTGLQFGSVYGTATYISTDSDAGTQTYRWTHKTGPEGIDLYAGSPGVSLGQSGDSYIEGSAIGSNAPRWDLIRWTTDPSVGANHDILVRLGNLTGTPSDYFTPTGDGLYAKAAWIEGNITAAAGEVAITDDGVNIAAYTATSGVPVENRITFTTSPMAPAANNTPAEMWAVKTATRNYANLRAYAGTGTNAERGTLTLDVYNETDAYPVSRITLDGGTTTGITLAAQQDATTPGTFAFQGGTVEWIGTHATERQIVRPSLDRRADLGDNSHWYQDLYVDTIYTNSVLGTSVDGHHHDGEYVTPAMLAADLAAYALDEHDHAEYATGSYVDAQIATRAALATYNAHAADTSIHAPINDAGIGAGELWSAQKINAVTSGLATAAWVSSQLSSYASAATLTAHTADTSIHFEINDAGTGAGEVWSADKITTTLGAYVTGATLAANYYNIAAVNAALAALAAAEHTHTALDNDLVIDGNLSVTGTVTAPAANVTSHLIAAEIRGNPGITFADYTGAGLIEILNNGTMRSLAPEWSSAGDGGWELTPTIQRFSNINASGSISSTVFEYQQIQVGVGSQMYTKGGGGSLRDELRIDSADNAAVTMTIQDPEAGHIQLFAAGDVLRIRGLATTEPRDSGAPFDAIVPGLSWLGVDHAPQTAVRDCWLDVIEAVDLGTHYAYNVTYRGGHRGVYRYQAGRAVANYGADGDGGIEITADQDAAPYIDIFRLDAGGATPQKIPTVRIGRLDGLPFVSTEQYGIALGSDMRTSTTARIVGSDQGLELYKVDYTANDGTADTVYISAAGRVKFGTDISDENTTAFDFNPALDTLTIRAAVDMLDGSGFAATSTLYWGAKIYGIDLEYAQASGGDVNTSFQLSNHGLRLHATKANPMTLEQEARLYVGDSVLDFGADTAAGYAWTPRIEFSDYAVLRTITDEAASVYSPGDDVITTDLVAISNPTFAGDIGARLAVATDYGADPAAYIGVYSRYGGFDATADINADLIYLHSNDTQISSDQTRVLGNFTWAGGTDANGQRYFFVLADLPTSDAGLPYGALWNDAGTIKIA